MRVLAALMWSGAAAEAFSGLSGARGVTTIARAGELAKRRYCGYTQCRTMHAALGMSFAHSDKSDAKQRPSRK
ncbi:unnamed protein product, partial [Chrysoparadoxa australica]